MSHVGHCVVSTLHISKQVKETADRSRFCCNWSEMLCEI